MLYHQVYQQGWHSSQGQRERGKKGAATARQPGTGGYNPQHLVDANKAWKQVYENDPSFRERMKKNLNTATLNSIRYRY